MRNQGLPLSGSIQLTMGDVRCCSDALDQKIIVKKHNVGP